MGRFIATSLLICLILAVLVKEIEAITSPCEYCSYCDFCQECHNCPCNESGNSNCKYCKYCKYCTACSMCSVCSEGGILDKLSGYLSEVKQRFGFTLEEIQEEDVKKDIGKLDVTKARQALKKKKDEL